MSNRTNNNGRKRHVVSGTVKKIEKTEKKDIELKVENSSALSKILGLFGKKGK